MADTRRMQQANKQSSLRLSDAISNAIGDTVTLPDRLKLSIRDRRIKRSLQHDKELSEVAQEMRAAILHTEKRFSEITGTAMKLPDPVPDKLLEGRGATGFYSFVSNRIYLSTSLFAPDVKESERLRIAGHEATHYLREKFEGRKYSSPRSKGIVTYHLLCAAEEGAAAFMGSVNSTRNPSAGTVMASLENSFNIDSIMEFYKAISSDVQSRSPGFPELDGYLSKRRRQGGWGLSVGSEGMRLHGRSVYTENYDTGAMLASMLLAANGFDVAKTAREILSSSNESLLSHVLEAAGRSDAAVEGLARSIDNAASEYAAKISEGYAEAEMKRQAQIRKAVASLLRQ